MVIAVEVGATGLVGSHILSTLLGLPRISSVKAYSRRPILSTSSKLVPMVEGDSSTWPSYFPSGARIFFSALGTTRSQAGSFDNQRKIDFDLNLALAKAAKEAGVETYVLISSGNPDVNSRFAFLRMKGELVEEIKALGFSYTIILHPGLILGERTDSRPLEFVARGVASFLGQFWQGALVNSFAQDASVIARAAVGASLQTLDGRREPGPWHLQQADIVRLGRSEWEEATPISQE